MKEKEYEKIREELFYKLWVKQLDRDIENLKFINQLRDKQG